MALPDAEWRRRKHLELAGVKYEIAITNLGEDSFRAAWMCRACCEMGAWAPVVPTEEEAIQAARLGLEVHHAIVH